MAAIPEQIHSQLLEARNLWAKAEASVDSDKAVAYMLFTQHNGTITCTSCFLVATPTCIHLTICHGHSVQFAR